MTCSVPDCRNPVFALGLCAKHYTRQRRHGDINKVNKSGRKPDDIGGIVDSLFQDVSPRTKVRIARALRLGRKIEEIFGVEGAYREALEQAMRTSPGGHRWVPFSRVLEIVKLRAISLIAELPDEDKQ
jgi:hypothetical protein